MQTQRDVDAVAEAVARETKRERPSVDDGGPAFPVTIKDGLEYARDVPGLTIRDYFAGGAMAAMLANTECMDALHDLTNSVPQGCRELARFAYMHADAMITERQRVNHGTGPES
jgi:hypothetical protein